MDNAKEMMSNLLSIQNQSSVEACFFAAKHQENLCGGAFLLRCGKNIHYLWGAVDRRFSHLCIGEAIQWSIIEWGSHMNYNKYDMEGISMFNSGNDKFKKKFGGEIIICSGIKIYSLYALPKLGLFFVNFLFLSST